MGLLVRPSWQDDLSIFKLEIDNIVYASSRIWFDLVLACIIIA
jgi:hypothetical protein